MRAPMIMAGLSLVGAFLLGSCGDGDGGQVLESDGRYVLTASFPTSNVAGVGGGGRVTMVGSCLGMQGQVIIWPEGTKLVASDPLTIEVPGFGRVAEGDHIEGASTHVSPPEDPAMPEDCASTSMSTFFAE